MPQIAVITNYAMMWVIAYFLIGIAIYFFDRKYGIRIYRWCHDLFHKDPMPKDLVRGLVYNQSTRRKAKIAFIVSTLQSLYMVWDQHINLVVELIVWLVEIPTMMGGFGVAAPLYKLFLRRDQLFDALDKVSHEVSQIQAGAVTGEVKSKMGEIFDALVSLPRLVWRTIRDFVFPPPTPRRVTPTPVARSEQAAPAEPRVEAPPQPDDQAALDRYIRR